jgi:hypothetical protein
MMRGIIFVIGIISFWACKDKSQQHIYAAQKKDSITSQKQTPKVYSNIPTVNAALDTLKKFSQVKKLKLTHFDNFTLYIGKNPEQENEVYIEDFELAYWFTFIQTGRRRICKLQDSTFREQGFSLSEIDYRDVNNDGHKDCIRGYAESGHGGTIEHISIYNPKTKEYEPNSFYEGGYVFFDKRTGLVCKTESQPRWGIKERFYIIGDSLAAKDAVEIQTKYSSLDSCVFKHYKWKTGKKILFENYRSENCEIPLRKFKSTLWDYSPFRK